jgi:phosphoglucomutase
LRYDPITARRQTRSARPSDRRRRPRTRGSPFNGSFTESHILAITQAICDHRRSRGIDGPLYLGKDTHAVSPPAEHTALEVLAANGVETWIQAGDEFTPTPVISRAILVHNRGRTTRLADGIVVTPSHNPPEDGGFKYNPPDGGPADTDVTGWIQDRANELLRRGNAGVKRTPRAYERDAATIHELDFIGPYVEDLRHVLDMEAIRAAGLSLAVDPLGGAGLYYWDRINETYGLNIEVVNRALDPTFSFMTVDHDGKIRMDCSSPWAMARLVALKDRYQVAFANDTDADRHGIVTAGAGLMNPNQYLAVAIDYLVRNREAWPAKAAIGKTVVSSSMIDRVVTGVERRLYEVPVGFKWFTKGLFDGSLAFGGEESAGASFLRRDGTVWTTDKDGPLLALLAAEITARTGKDPGKRYLELTERYGPTYYTRIDVPATAPQKAGLAALAAKLSKLGSFAGEAVTGILTAAPANGAAIGGFKLSTQSGWFAARPSGTEDIYKIYAESFRDAAHLDALVSEAQRTLNHLLSNEDPPP